MAVLVELCTFSPGIQQLTCTYYLPPGIQIEEETVPLLAALPVQFNRRSPQSGLGRDMHDVHSSANLPSSPLGSPKEPRILSTLREGYEEKKDGEDELKQAELSISSDALLPSPRPGREPDPGLTGRGKEQAKAVAELLQKIKEDPKTESRQALATLTLSLTRLADKDATELRGMADRLTKVEEMLKDLEIERDLLQKEKGQLNETISLFMKELQKLHIGSQNTVEPMLEEGPLDFVGRFWETVKPRDTAYVAGEHIGEIRKPGEKPEGPNPLAALKQAALAHGVPHELPNVNVQVQDMGKQAVKKLSTAFEEARSSAFWQRAQGYWEEKRSEIAKKVDEVRVSAADTWQHC
ncbi:Integrase catalytic domain-containing protein [Durusdinium trenchii]|uniref:Integrase catalytic domain-containing protein n=1 Tax=Durusdinium trenchii TaxID=1381693 RepID=A0ABP0SMC3_9DINO